MGAHRRPIDPNNRDEVGQYAPQKSGGMLRLGGRRHDAHYRDQTIGGSGPSTENREGSQPVSFKKANTGTIG